MLATDEFANHAILLWQDGELIKDQWPLNDAEAVIGRDEACAINIPSRWISRRHARILQKEYGFVIEDLGSKNGLYINGQRIHKPHQLEDGDKIQLAPGLDLTFVDSEATAPLPGRSAPQLRMDRAQRQIYLRGQLLTPPLSAQQYQVLSTLAEHPGKVYSRYEIIAAAWPDDYADGVSDDAIDAMMRRLRQRLAQLDPDFDYIITVRGYGFKLNLTTV